MIRDQIVAIADKVPAEYSNPLVLGAVRLASDLDWAAEARSAIRFGRRVVLCGDISDPRNIAQQLLALINDDSNARFALLLHWSQARQFAPPAELYGHFDDVYVAIDRALTPEELAVIQRHWGAKWVILPSLEVDWSKWIPETLLHLKTGPVSILAPKSSYGYIGEDELRIMLAHLKDDHPTLSVLPAPAEWFVPSELNPWRSTDRKIELPRKIFDSRHNGPFPFTAVVPYRWQGNERSVANLRRCLDSIQKTFSGPSECEIILAVDTEDEVNDLARKLDTESRRDFAIVQVPRIPAANVLAIPADEDWRAGFVRNVGAAFASASIDRTSKFIFVDSDVEVVQPIELREAIRDSNFELFQLVDEKQAVGFENATSMFIAIRRTLFQKVGGFADAFSHYGAEDNFLVWKCQQQAARIRPIAKSNIRHLREPRDSDELYLKMLRLRQSGSLMYRMTLDPTVHRHFYVTLEKGIPLRGSIKWLSESQLGRILLAPFVFLLTFGETERRLNYLRSFYEAYLLTFYFSRIERFGYFLQHHLADYSRRTYYFARHKRFQLFFFLREGYFYLRHHLRAAARSTFYFARHKRFQLFFFLREGYSYLRHHLRAATVRFYYDSRHLFDLVVIKLRAAFNFCKFRIQPLYYSLHRQFGRLIISNLWLLKDPTAWVMLKAPLFYRWVWRPVLKIRFFITYHLFIRWRNS